MEKYNITFKFVNGETQKYLDYTAQSYNHVASDIMRGDGWFGVKGEVINLANVLSATIEEAE